MSNKLSFKDRKRLLILVICLSFLFSLLLLTFYKIQIVEQDHWKNEANKQHYFIVKEPSLRGTFMANASIKKGHPDLESPQRFVFDILKYHIYIDPQSIPVNLRREMSDHLTRLLKLSEKDQEILKAQFEKKSRNRRVASWLEPLTKDHVLEWWTPFAKAHKIPRNALYSVRDYQRSYPFGKLLGQVLHTVQHNRSGSQDMPTGGLELYFDTFLRGKQGKRRLMRSPRNSLETGEIISRPQNGAEIYLTINHFLQAIAEEEIAKGVVNCKAESGWAVMMDPKTGEILALAQYPFFHPSDYAHFFNDLQLIEHTKVRAITDANEPGSVMKPFTLAAGLIANAVLKQKNAPPIFDPGEKTPTSNPYFPGRKKPLPDTRFHKFLNMEMALQKSSNIYMARIAEKIVQRLGAEWYRRFLQEVFGFGTKTGIELPSESPGVLPGIGKKHPNGTFEWSASTPYSLAIGHNIQTTTLQQLRASAVLINGGYLVEPTLIRKIIRRKEDGSEEILRDNTKEERVQRFRKVLPKEIADQIVQAMKYATKPGGTARRADIWGYTEAGKTGTADKIVNGKYCPQKVCSTFIGAVHLSDPPFVLAVVMNEPEYGYRPGIGRLHHGGTCSAPVFREISRRSLDYLGIAPDDPFGYPIGDPRYHPEKADWMPEATRLREIYEQWNMGK